MWSAPAQFSDLLTEVTELLMSSVLRHQDVWELELRFIKKLISPIWWWFLAAEKFRKMYETLLSEYLREELKLEDMGERVFH